MLKTKEIKNLFSEFCKKWNYEIETFDERVSLVLLKKDYVIYEKYIFVDLIGNCVGAYKFDEKHSVDLLYHYLTFDEFSDLYSIINSIKNLNMED